MLFLLLCLEYFLQTEKIESEAEELKEDLNANKIIADGITTRSGAAKRRAQKAD